MTSTAIELRNRIPLYTELDGELVSHFSLYEFENADGLVTVHPALVRALELVRRDLNEEVSDVVRSDAEVSIVITDGTRTAADLSRLAQRLGWTTNGGAVSPTSKHLYTFGGIAVDVYAHESQREVRVPSGVLGSVCRRYFDFVKDDYTDGHVHADLRRLTV